MVEILSNHVRKSSLRFFLGHYKGWKVETGYWSKWGHRYLPPKSSTSSRTSTEAKQRSKVLKRMSRISILWLAIPKFSMSIRTCAKAGSRDRIRSLHSHFKVLGSCHDISFAWREGYLNIFGYEYLQSPQLQLSREGPPPRREGVWYGGPILTSWRHLTAGESRN